MKARDYSQRKAAGQTRPRAVVSLSGENSPAWYADPQESAPTGEFSPPGRVEAAVEVEIGSAGDLRPGLAAVALAMARLLDDPRARNQAPAASKVLVSVLDALGKVAAPRRRSHLGLVREMTTKGGA